MIKIQSLTVIPSTPEKLKPLLEIAYNLWFSWNWDARQLFEKIDHDSWIDSNKNPLKLLCRVPRKRLEELAEDSDYVSEVNAVHQKFQTYLKSKTWFEENFDYPKTPMVAYFSCEFGIHESLRIFAGGMGVCAGDHLKAASDLGVPLVAVGLLYREGYFKQGITSDGTQQEFYPENDWYTMPVKLEKRDHHPILVPMHIGDEEVKFQIWRVQVGRTRLLLLDTNIEENPPHLRNISKRLYDSNKEVRVRQELLLGIGGVKALKELDYEPQLYHINESHPAFLIVERIKNLMTEKSLNFREAFEYVKLTNVFTTHTAAHPNQEKFQDDLLVKYISPIAKELGISWKEFLDLGKDPITQSSQNFNMSIFAIKSSSFVNGVSAPHLKVAKKMWDRMFPKLPIAEIPIHKISNGVHTGTFLNRKYEALIRQEVKDDFRKESADLTVWQVIDNVPLREIWRIHNELKEGMISYVRQRLKREHYRRGSRLHEIKKIDQVLDPNVLTIGYARRFVSFKRPDLILKDLERFKKLILDKKRPIQIIFAGKAHPADNIGKEIIKQVVQLSYEEELFNRVVFLENFNIDMARYLTQGVDIWLNTARTPLEAAGTSSMKAAMNGVLNFSVKDGLWAEAFNNSNGWCIGNGEEYNDMEYQDSVESDILYQTLEQEIAPLYYNRNEDNFPEDWVYMMRDTILTCGTMFNSQRMLKDYLEKAYLPLIQDISLYRKEGMSKVKVLSSWKQKVENCWSKVKILSSSAPDDEVILSGEEIKVTASLDLQELNENDVQVEAFHGTLNYNQSIDHPEITVMKFTKKEGNYSIFEGNLKCNFGGHYGYTIRVFPKNKKLNSDLLLDRVKWIESEN